MFSVVVPSELLERSHGFVENAGRPEGYEAQRTILKERDALAPTEGLDSDNTLYTTQPSIRMDATPAAFSDGWTECLLYPDVKALILTTPGFPSPLFRPSSRGYRLGPSPNKGRGLFTTRKISAGDLVLSERPLTLTPAWISTRVRYLKELTAEEKVQTQIYEWEQTFKVLFDRLHPDYRTAFMALANSHQRDGSGPIGGIIRTNALGVRCLQTGRYSAEEARTLRRGIYSAVCREISRLNHSCSPNTTAKFDVASFSYQLFAARDIPKGEELKFSYTALNALAEARQTELEPYGFRCTCSACRTPESDARRALSFVFPVETIEDCLEKLSLLEEEGLQVAEEYCETLKSLMNLYLGRGDVHNASKYARKLASRPWSPLADLARSYPLHFNRSRC
ncbi:hypothetical protein DFH07DRAFT_734269 [Mycena maculata]|uniref:SET domain-containing protein n=1 Tax=Mycena maculata TaxID=230809 RepID=A0AAD7JUE8_9AGAR|nr:hypothetical protein DFH07DRAFT_734269 [Mycena maculata]